MQNCKIKLSDECRDNFFRSANCGMGIEEIKTIKNIHIKGIGVCVLEGADHPRAVGDSSKILANPCPKLPEDIIKYADWVPEERRAVDKLDFWDQHIRSYGTDAGKEGESQFGDWRGIGILFACVENFSIENIKIVDSHGWGISLENCAYGRVEKIEFDMCMAKEIDGMLHNMENQDGVDIRNGCHDIVISDITGDTGDDLVALTAVADRGNPIRKSGELKSTHVMHNDWSRREADIHDITIRNICGKSASGICNIIRLLPVCTKIYNVIIDGVIDNTTANRSWGSTILLGEQDGAYGKNNTDGISEVIITNVICNSDHAISVDGYIRNSVISNIVNKNPDCEVIKVNRKNGMINVKTDNLVTVRSIEVDELDK